MKYQLVSGMLSIKERTEMTRRFQEVCSDQVFDMSLKAAGTGLNLTAASHVIHFDLEGNGGAGKQVIKKW